MQLRDKSNRSKRLEPGRQLKWSRPPQGQPEAESGYGNTVFGTEHGEPVAFVKYREAPQGCSHVEQIQGKYIELDIGGFPLIQVQTQQGKLLDLSAFWFDWS